jgi:hypothetical protein
MTFGTIVQRKSCGLGDSALGAGPDDVPFIRRQPLIAAYEDDGNAGQTEPVSSESVGEAVWFGGQPQYFQIIHKVKDGDPHASGANISIVLTRVSCSWIVKEKTAESRTIVSNGVSLKFTRSDGVDLLPVVPVRDCKLT